MQQRYASQRPYRLFVTVSLFAVAILLWTPHIALAKLIATASDGTLTIVSDGADAIVLTCTEGQVQINGDGPDSGGTDCASLSDINVVGGPGSNTIDLSGVITDDFTSLATITLNGGGGNDVITGTSTIDTLGGGAGDDVLAGGKDDDTLNGGPGNDELIWRNGDNSDIMEGGEGADTVHVIGAAGRGDAFAIAPNGERVTFTRTNLVPFTLDIGATEILRIYHGDITDTVQVSVLPATQVIIDSILPSTTGEAAAPPTPMVIVGAGAITKTIEAYRLLLGGENNGGEPGAQPTGYREINWDSVPDELAAPNFYPADFFNAPTPPRARGIILTTPGEGLLVSADSENPDNALPRFGDINPGYADSFQTFSTERLFSPVGSNIVDLTFYVPGTDTPAVSRGFGAVYTDIDTEHTAFEYFDLNGNSLGTFQAPIADNGLSFLGVIFPEPVVHQVQIRYGTGALGPDDSAEVDVAVMDNFVYAEPQPAAAVAESDTGSELEAKFQTVEEQRLSTLVIDLASLPAPAKSQQYAVWLIDDNEAVTLAGAASVDEVFTYQDPAGANLVGTVVGVMVSLEDAAAVAAGTLVEPTAIHYAGEIPTSIRPDVRLLVVAAPDTPANAPYDPGLNAQAALALAHGQLALDAYAAGDSRGGRMHIEHVWNILHGEASDLYGDVNEDGQIQNPGDGYGVWPYAFKTAEVADRVAETPGLDDHRREAATGVGICARNISGEWRPAATDAALAVLQAYGAEASQTATQTLVDALNALLAGVDANGNGEIEPIAGECGAESAYQLSHHLFDLHLEPVQE